MVARAWTGTFLSALEMSGVSLSLMRLDAPLLAALDAPAEASAWPAAHLGQVATRAIMQVGGAKQGDRTMLDALIPAANAWADARQQPLAQALQQAAIAAKQGCAATAEVVARSAIPILAPRPWPYGSRPWPTAFNCARHTAAS